MRAAIDVAFAHSWQAEILRERPLILPPRHFTYPREAEEIERGALEVLVRPETDSPFLATFALGFADPVAPSGLWSCPNADELCAVAGGYAYIVNTRAPEQFSQIEFRPVFHVQPIVEHELLLFGGSHALLAWGKCGLAWKSPRLSSEGLRITGMSATEIQGFGWDLMTDREIPFTIDPATGERLGGNQKPPGVSPAS